MRTWQKIGNRASFVVLCMFMVCSWWFVTGALPAYAAGGSISGTVTDEEGQPLANIGVYLYIDPTGLGFWGPTGVYVMTDQSGQYTIAELEPGAYRLALRDSGWPLRYATEYYDNALRVEDATDIPVTNTAVVGINAQLAVASRIEGIVMDANNQPIESIQVSLWARDSANPNRWVTAGLQATTDSSGAYSFAGVDTGRYRMSFTDTRFPHLYTTEYYANATLAQATELVVPGQKLFVINAQLAATSAVAGMVTDEEGAPLAGITVGVSNDSESDGWNSSLYAPSSVTNENGAYTISGVEVGPNRICFADYTAHYADECYDNAPTIARATDVTVTVGATLTLNAQLERRGGIQGTVTDSTGQPLAFYQVLLYIDPEDDGTWVADATHWVYTNETGVYTLSALNPDVYRVQFVEPAGQVNAPEFYSDALTIAGATDVVVQPGQITPHIDAQLEPFSHITGMVTDAQGQPLENMRVAAYNMAPDAASLPSLIPFNSTSTRQDGTYNLTGLLPGDYYVEFADPFNNALHTEYYDDAGYLMTAAKITVGRVMTVTNINAQLAPFEAINYPPFATDDRAYVLEGGTTKTVQMPWGPEFTVLINDRDAEFVPLTTTLVTTPTHGTVTLAANGAFTYTHDGSETTQDVFSYRAFDGVHDSNVATVTLTITPIFDLPIAVSDALSVTYGGSTTHLLTGATSLLANDLNPEGQSLTATLATTPTHGLVALAPDGTFIYSHDGSYTTDDHFSYRVTTVGGFVSTPATVTVTIQPVASIEFTTTVWVAGLPAPCGITNTLRVPVSTTVAYCYAVRNSGIITLTYHDLVDDQLGVILTSQPYTLTPGATHSVIVTQTIAVTTTNVAIWSTASSRLTPVQPITATATATVTLSAPGDDQDQDGIPDVVELAGDGDQDNLPNFLDADADGDGVSDQVEAGADPLNPQDSNHDGVADYLDPLIPYGQRLYLPIVAKQT
ncbi:MAG: carboxypeptidase regulatory-like domain-containing protein [Caldilineaceae bacterium]